MRAGEKMENPKNLRFSLNVSYIVDDYVVKRVQYKNILYIYVYKGFWKMNPVLALRVEGECVELCR